MLKIIYGDDTVKYIENILENKTENKNNKQLPLVYSCSGCSDIAQLANHVALELDRNEIAEMSCIAGVGGGVKPLVKKAQSGREIIAIDGCPLHCAKHCLENAGVEPTVHYTLTEFGLKKKYHNDFDPANGEIIIDKILEDMNTELIPCE